MQAIKSCSLLLPALLALSSCSGSTMGELDGTVSGQAFGDVQSAFFIDETPDDAGALHQIRLVMTSYADGCISYPSYVDNQADPTGEGPFNVLYVLFQQIDPLTAQTYELGSASPPNRVDGQFLTYSSEERQWVSTTGTGGSVTIDALDASSMSGSLSVSLTNGDRLEGEFEAVACMPEG